ncbi:MAG: diacylglycerol kinase family lipid kinase [Parasporobacterium sp.]|nr:diacylglycerol kinase family lipid kinase [Parasporobacterium sp.]
MIHFIVNPSSRSGQGKKIWEQVEAFLKESGTVYDSYFTKNYDETVAYVQDVTNSDEPLPHHLAILGGDGTVNEVINGIFRPEDTCISYLPTGSGNDLASCLGIRKDALSLAKRLSEDLKQVSADIGEAVCSRDDGQPPLIRRFLISSGIGFDAACCDKSSGGKLKKFLNRVGLGKLSYVASSLYCLRHAPEAKCVLTLGNRTAGSSEDPKESPGSLKESFDDFLFCVGMIQKSEGGGFPFCPDADPSDSLFDMCLIHHVHLWRFLRLMPLARFGKHVGSRFIVIKRAARISVHTDVALTVHTDGEVLGKFTHLDIRNPEHNKITFYL